MLPADEAVSMVIPRKNLGIVNDDGKEKKSNKAQTGKKITPIIWAAAIILLLGCSITYFVFFNNTKGNSASDLNWEEVNLLLQNKKYTEVIAKLRTRVSDPAAQADTAFYSRMIPLYAKALLGSGDTSMAVPYLEKGVQLGNSDCIFEVGSVYYNGKFRAKDYKKAFEYFEKGAALNDPKAEVMLGNMYFMGLGVPENYGEAIRYYFSAADHGNSVAMYALGLAYLNGSGVTEDPLEARKWFQKVIDKNDNPAAVTAAQTQLAGM
jgi:TPR repeat protein